MNSNKYYSPTDDEFHVGFEFELGVAKGNDLVWKKQQVKRPNYIAWGGKTIWEILENPSYNIRVKYLDMKGIESLGFNYLCNKNDSEIYQYRDIYLYYYYLTGHVVIKRKVVLKKEEIDENIYYKDVILFDGKLKNKSELIKLLFQLDIGYESQ